MKTISIGSDPLTIEDLISIARFDAKVNLANQSERLIQQTGNLVDKWVREGKRIYGVTTGFGALSDVAISEADTRKLQKNILMSHAAGVGECLDQEIVRATMALRISDAAKGHSGIRLQTIQHLITFLNNHVYPVIPEKGSVGASGDLAPLAHLSLVLIGLGEVFQNGKRIPGSTALEHLDLKPLQLEASEGLSLVNGTQIMTGTGAITVYDAHRLSRMADISAAMSLEVLMGSKTEFDPRIHKVRPHPGQSKSADNLLRIIQDSEIISSHKDCDRIQDAYTLRCSPQVHGATKDMISHARESIETEMNSATGNPLFFSDSEEFLLGGNFHGQPIALALDALTMGISELANISERRIERLVNPQLSGLPAFLVTNGGLNSGFMIVQYTAASLVSENKVLAHPACVDSIPTSANKEDHVSMGSISARKCREVVKNAEYVIAIELLCAAQAMDLFTNMKPGKGTLAAYKALRKAVGHLDEDRVLSYDIETVKRLIHDETILNAVEAAVGILR